MKLNLVSNNDTKNVTRSLFCGSASYIHSKTPIPSITYTIGTVTDYTVTGQWLTVKSPLLTGSSMVTTQLINWVVTVLPVVVNSDYTVTFQSLCSHFA